MYSPLTAVLCLQPGGAPQGYPGGPAPGQPTPNYPAAPATNPSTPGYGSGVPSSPQAPAISVRLFKLPLFSFCDLYESVLVHVLVKIHWLFFHCSSCCVYMSRKDTGVLLKTFPGLIHWGMWKFFEKLWRVLVSKLYLSNSYCLSSECIFA